MDFSRPSLTEKMRQVGAVAPPGTAAAAAPAGADDAGDATREASRRDAHNLPANVGAGGTGGVRAEAPASTTQAEPEDTPGAASSGSAAPAEYPSTESPTKRRKREGDDGDSASE